MMAHFEELLHGNAHRTTGVSVLEQSQSYKDPWLLGATSTGEKRGFHTVLSTVLLVDDERSVRETVRAALEQRGYTVLDAATYWDALRTSERHAGAIDLLITDIALPDNNGCELADRIASAYPSIPVIFTSGQAGFEVCKFYNMTSSDPRLLKKPFEIQELLQRVDSALGPRCSKCQAGAQ